MAPRRSAVEDALDLTGVANHDMSAPKRKSLVFDGSRMAALEGQRQIEKVYAENADALDKLTTRETEMRSFMKRLSVPTIQTPLVGSSEDAVSKPSSSRSQSPLLDAQHSPPRTLDREAVLSDRDSMPSLPNRRRNYSVDHITYSQSNANTHLDVRSGEDYHRGRVSPLLPLGSIQGVSGASDVDRDGHGEMNGPSRSPLSFTRPSLPRKNRSLDHIPDLSRLLSRARVAAQVSETIPADNTMFDGVGTAATPDSPPLPDFEMGSKSKHPQKLRMPPKRRSFEKIQTQPSPTRTVEDEHDAIHIPQVSEAKLLVSAEQSEPRRMSKSVSVDFHDRPQRPRSVNDDADARSLPRRESLGGDRSDDGPLLGRRRHRSHNEADTNKADKLSPRGVSGLASSGAALGGGAYAHDHLPSCRGALPTETADQVYIPTATNLTSAHHHLSDSLSNIAHPDSEVNAPSHHIRSIAEPILKTTDSNHPNTSHASSHGKKPSFSSTSGSLEDLRTPHSAVSSRPSSSARKAAPPLEITVRLNALHGILPTPPSRNVIFPRKADREDELGDSTDEDR